MIMTLIIAAVSAIGGGVGTYFFLRHNPQTTVKIEQAVDSAVSKISSK